MHRTASLAQSPLFQVQSESLPLSERIQLSYDRAKAVVQFYGLTSEDILHLSHKYWEFHTDPILLMDGAMGTLLTIHYNLCAGTLAMFAPGRPDVSQTLQKLLNFELSGQYCLTEVGHGLDAINLETTATLLSNGEFELNTPTKQAAKYMPPTAPCGIPCVSIVFARLMVDREDRGIKPFLVPLHDGKNMYSGIVCKPLSPRGAARPVNHALTYFHHTRLPQNALLGDAARASDLRLGFFQNISRVMSGTLSMGAFALSAMRIACHIAGSYSLRRHIVDTATKIHRPIFSFSTQYIPILAAISQTLVMQAFARDSHTRFVDTTASPTMKHAVAAIFKATVFKHTHNVLLTLGDRCGAQGLFEVNQLSVMHGDMRGASIAEGDILGISIRFAMEILLGRIILPPPTNPDTLLAKHEQSLISGLKQVMSQATGHRDARMESMLLPQCQPLLEAIGHRFALEAAVDQGLDDALITLYVASVVGFDPAWYAENAGISRWKQNLMLLDAATPLYSRLEELMTRLDVENYVTAPIASDDRWDAYVRSLDTLGDPQVCSPTLPEPLPSQSPGFVAKEPSLVRSRL